MVSHQKSVKPGAQYPITYLTTNQSSRSSFPIKIGEVSFYANSLRIECAYGVVWLTMFVCVIVSARE